MVAAVILRVEAEGIYCLSEPDAGLEFRADYLRRDSRSGEISGELSVSCSEHAARVDNLLSVAHSTSAARRPGPRGRS